MGRREAWDAIVVGSGLSGILVAETLCASGWRCLVLEAGPLPGPGGRSALDAAARSLEFTEVDEASWSFRSNRPFDWRRVRAGGGRSLIWGGWCIPPEPSCLLEARQQGATWPLDFAELAPFVDPVARFLRVKKTRLHPRLRALGDALGIELAGKQGSTSPRDGGPVISLEQRRKAKLRAHAVVLRVVRDDTGAAAGVEVAAGASGETEVLRARVVVLAASPVESARIVHQSDPRGIGAVDGPLGRGLVDHMASTFWVINDEPPPPQLLIGPHDRAAWSIARWGKGDDGGAFVLEVFGPLKLSAFDDAWLAAVGVDRRDAESLSAFMVYTAAAATPTPRRRVTFDAAQRDAHGRPVPVLQLAWSARDRIVAGRIDRAARLAAEGLGETGRIIRFRDPLDPGGIGHEAGTCRMGVGDDSVTDRFGEVRGIPRLFVADGSILPCLFGRHPTWTLLAMSLRVADTIGRRGRRTEL